MKTIRQLLRMSLCVTLLTTAGCGREHPDDPANGGSLTAVNEIGSGGICPYDRAINTKCVNNVCVKLGLVRVCFLDNGVPIGVTDPKIEDLLFNNPSNVNG